LERRTKTKSQITKVDFDLMRRVRVRVGVRVSKVRFRVSRVKAMVLLLRPDYDSTSIY